MRLRRQILLKNHDLSRRCRIEFVSQSHDSDTKPDSVSPPFATMAMNGSPTIIEPTTSSDSPLPSIASLSPHTSSSSDSLDSSRPSSPGSSATSPSVSPSPIPKSLPAIDSQESIELPALPSNSPPPPDNISASQSHPQNDPPRSIPAARAVSPKRNNGTSWLSRLGALVHRRSWYSNALGTIGLGLTLFGMIMFGERTYRLAVWSAWNDTLDTCGQLNSVSSFGLYLVYSICMALTLP